MCSGDAAQHCVPVSEESVNTFNQTVKNLRPLTKQMLASVGTSSQELVVYASPSCPAPNTKLIADHKGTTMFNEPEHSVLKLRGDGFVGQPRQLDDPISFARLGVDRISTPSERLLEIAPPEAPKVLSAEVSIPRVKVAGGRAPATTAMKALVPMPYATAPHAKALVPIAKLRKLWPSFVPKARGVRTNAIQVLAGPSLGASGWRRSLRHRIACSNSTDLESTGACFLAGAYNLGFGTDSQDNAKNAVAARRFLKVRSPRQSVARFA